MSENRRVITVESEDELPPGNLVSYEGDILELSEQFRKDILIWDVSNKSNDEKLVNLYVTKNAFNSNAVSQAKKDIIKKEYKILNVGIISSNLIGALYEKRQVLESQKVNGDSSLVVQLFEIILRDALSEGISDIHLEAREHGGSSIKMRKDGELFEYKEENKLNYQQANSLASVIYNVLAASTSKSVNFDPREFQQGAVSYTIDQQDLKLRFQSLPTATGFDVVLRVLPIGKAEEFTPLQKLGYTEQQMLELLDIVSRPVGGLIIAGVTGSGKSTTLKNLLMFMNTNTGFRKKIYTIEDPPEYNISRVSQIPVPQPKDNDIKKESPFAKPIKACMRGDPDIIMIGEVRDETTGDLMKKAIQSGHQVLTTVHSTSALGIIERFQDFKITKSVLGSPEFLSGLLYQKLLPKVCTHCGIDFNTHLESEKVTQKDIDLFHRMSKIVSPKKYQIKIRNPNGCEFCQNRGIVGRTVVAEVIMIDLNMLQFIEQGLIIPLMRHWRSLSDGDYYSTNMRGKTCMEHAFQKVLSGIVCPYDLEESFKPINEIVIEDENPKLQNEGLRSQKNNDNSNNNGTYTDV